MKLKPTKSNLVVTFLQPKGNTIITSANETLSATLDDSQRTRVRIEALSIDLIARGELATGLFVLLRPKPNLLPIGKNAEGHALLLIDASSIEAIVLDDVAP